MSIAAGSLLAAVLGLAGCAGQIAQSDLEDRTRVATAEPPAAEAPPAQAKPKPKIAAAKTSATYTVAAGEAPSRTAIGRDEASCIGVETCAAVLKAMVASTDRTWIDRPAAPAVLANGVRLFAYRALRSKLNCGELATALSEVEAAQRGFSGPVGDLEPEQVQRVRGLSVEVGGELRAERARRCAPQSKEGPVGSVPSPPRG